MTNLLLSAAAFHLCHRLSGASADLYIVPELFRFTEETLHFDRPIGLKLFGQFSGCNLRTLNE